MFELKKHKVIIPGIHAITSGQKILFNDGDNDTIYIGKNKFDNFVLGVIMGESADYYDSVHDKIAPQQELKSPSIEHDLKPRLYNILIINFSTDTGVGRAIFNIDGIDNQASKIRINVSGRTSYENTPFTESLHNKKVISVEGTATRQNGIVKTISFQLEALSV